MPALLTLIIWILVAGLIFSLLWWAINHFPIPDPFRMVAQGILIILAIVVLIYLLMGILPPFPAR